MSSRCVHYTRNYIGALKHICLYDCWKSGRYNQGRLGLFKEVDRINFHKIITVFFTCFYYYFMIVIIV